MATRKVPFNKKGISKLPEDKPVLYRIQTEGGKLNYTGIAKRGRVQDRLQEHLGEIPGPAFESISSAAFRTPKLQRNVSSSGMIQSTTGAASRASTAAITTLAKDAAGPGGGGVGQHGTPQLAPADGRPRGDRFRAMDVECPVDFGRGSPFGLE